MPSGGWGSCEEGRLRDLSRRREPAGRPVLAHRCPATEGPASTHCSGDNRRGLMPEIISCPDCDRKLRVPEDLLGKKVKCPGCGITFTATSGGGGKAPPPAAG